MDRATTWNGEKDGPALVPRDLCAKGEKQIKCNILLLGRFFFLLQSELYFWCIQEHGSWSTSQNTDRCRADRQTDRKTEKKRQIERQTHTHICAGRQADRDRHTNRHANTKTDRQRQTVRHTHRKFREMTSSPLQDWKPGAWRKVTEWEKISPPRLSWNEHSPACVKHLKGQQSLAWAESVEQSSTDVVNGQPPSRKRGLSAKSLPTKNCSTVVAI